jgi:hypothetical protein
MTFIYKFLKRSVYQRLPRPIKFFLLKCFGLLGICGGGGGYLKAGEMPADKMNFQSNAKRWRFAFILH